MPRATGESVRRTAEHVNARNGRRATSYDVARLAGVSQSAVSRVFSAGSSASPEMRKRVQAAAQQLGFSPNLLARGLIKQRSNIVALIITEVTTRYTPAILYRFGVELQAAGLHLLLFTVEGESPSDAVMAQLLDYPVDGVVSCATLTDAQFSRLAARGVPVVLFNRFARDRAVSAVACDHAAMGATIACTLHDAGHRRFAFVSGPATAPVSRERERGFREELLARGVQRVARIYGDYTYDSGMVAGHRIAALRPRPDAVYCANDAMALGVLDALRLVHSVPVPEAIAVVGFDDIAEASLGAYRLTTVRPPLPEMVRRSIDLLQRHIADPDAPMQHVLLPGELQARATTR